MTERVLYALMGTGAATWLVALAVGAYWALRHPRHIAIGCAIVAVIALVVVLFRREPEVCTVVSALLAGAGAAAFAIGYVAHRPAVASIVITALAGGLAFLAR